MPDDTRRYLVQCEACGKAFLQTDARQRFCPPTVGAKKSTCMNRLRIRRYRDKKARRDRTA
jgi:hypothetical protein